MTVKGKVLVPAEVNVQPTEGPRVCITFETEVDGYTNGTFIMRTEARALAAVMKLSSATIGMRFEAEADSIRYTYRPGKGARITYDDDEFRMTVRLDDQSVIILAQELAEAADTLVSDSRRGPA